MVTTTGSVKIKRTSSRYHEFIRATSARKSVAIKIRFKKGASHKSWRRGTVSSVWDVAGGLINGTYGGNIGYSGTARPIFENYREMREDFIKDTIAKMFSDTYSHWSYADRLAVAGERIKRDLVEQVKMRKLGLAPNTGDYARRKRHQFGLRAPFEATGALLKELEVKLV